MRAGARSRRHWRNSNSIWPTTSIRIKTMIRQRREIISFTRDDIERIVRQIAHAQIVGSLFIGKFHEQSIRWTVEGGVEVITRFEQGDIDDLAPQPNDQPKLPRRGRK